MRAVSVISLAMLVGACASVTRGTTEQVQINSNPSEAQAKTSMGYVCVTPCTLQSNRKDEFVVTISKPGYHTAEIPVKTHVGGGGAAGFAGNIILGGAVGMVADAATGATLDHYPNPIAVTLLPVRKGEAPRVIRIEPPTEGAPSPAQQTAAPAEQAAAQN